MTTNRRLHAAVVAAAGYLVVAAITLVAPQPNDHWNAAGRALEAAFIAGLLGSVVAIPAVTDYLTQRSFGRLAGRLAQVGYLSMAIASAASLIKGGDTLGPVFVLGVFATLLGLLLLGLGGIREGLAPRWTPVVPFASMLVGIALADHGGCAVIAAGWIVMTVVMSSSSTAAPAATAVA